MVSGQSETISGNVSDGEGTPLVGVNILIQNTSNGTQTDTNGNSLLEVDLAKERSSVGMIYEQIISDLTDAYNLLPEHNGVFADKFAAAAYLSRVYLQQGVYDLARDMAHEVITASGHELNTTYEQAFNNNSDSTEDLFSIQISIADGFSYLSAIYASSENGGDGNGDWTSLTNTYFEIFDDPNNGLLLISKYMNEYANIPIVRLTEMYLIRAEANYRINTSVGQSALDDINELRMRANAFLLTDVDLNDIWLERQRELSFEGRLIHDYKRFKFDVGNLPYDSPKLVCPIPLGEINTNPLIEQNPGF